MAEILEFTLVVALLIFSSVQVLRRRSLLLSALWLAGMSAMTSILLYLLFARQVAVIELSVGAGLVTVLFIFAISLAGDEQIERSSIIPGVVAGILVIGSLALIVFLHPPLAGTVPLPPVDHQSAAYNQDRGLDLVVQVVVIFAGVVGLVGILAEAKAPLDHPIADEIAARREQDLRSMELQSMRPLEGGGQATSGALASNQPAADATPLKEPRS